MRSEEPDEHPGEESPWFAIFAALLAVFLHAFALLAVLGLVGAGNLIAAVGMSALVAYPLAFSLLATRSAEPPPVLLGLVPARSGSTLAVFLLLGSLVLTSEIDNITRAALPPPELEPSEAPQGPAPIWQLFVVQVLVLPLVFELFYRGAVQPRLIRVAGSARGILATASLSAVGTAFYYPWLFLPALAGHSLLGVLRHCSGSARPAVALHMLSGVVALGAHHEIFGIPGFDDLSVPHTPAIWLLPAAVATAMGLWQCRRLLGRL